MLQPLVVSTEPRLPTAVPTAASVGIRPVKTSAVRTSTVARTAAPCAQPPRAGFRGRMPTASGGGRGPRAGDEKGEFPSFAV